MSETWDKLLKVRRVEWMKLQQKISILAQKIKKEKEKLILMEDYYQKFYKPTTGSLLASELKLEKNFLDNMQNAYQSQKTYVVSLSSQYNNLVKQGNLLSKSCEQLEEAITEQKNLEIRKKIDRL